MTYKNVKEDSAAYQSLRPEFQAIVEALNKIAQPGYEYVVKASHTTECAICSGGECDCELLVTVEETPPIDPMAEVTASIYRLTQTIAASSAEPRSISFSRNKRGDIIGAEMDS